MSFDRKGLEKLAKEEGEPFRTRLDNLLADEESAEKDMARFEHVLEARKAQEKAAREAAAAERKASKEK